MLDIIKNNTLISFKNMKYWSVYMVKCSDGSYYTGYTNNLEKRIKTHNSGKGAKYTRARLPVKLKWYATYNTKSAAMKVEYQIKRLSRKEKEFIINSESTALKVTNEIRQLICHYKDVGAIKIAELFTNALEKTTKFHD